MGNVGTKCTRCFLDASHESDATAMRAPTLLGSPKTNGKAWASPVPSPKMNDVTEKLTASEKPIISGRWSQLQRNPFEVEQILNAPGNLPKPLSCSTLEQVPRSNFFPEGLDASGPEGQEIRRRFVAGATVVFFTAGYAGKRFVFQRAMELGIKSVIIDDPSSWSRSLVDEGIVAKFVPIDMSQSSDQIFQQSLEQIKQLGEDGLTGPVDAVTTFVELSVPVVALLCERLGLPCASPAAVDAARDKHATRAALKAAGLATPRNCLIHSDADIQSASQQVGFPAVLKPISGAASLGVKKVTQASELLACYREVVDELNSLVVVSGSLEKGDASTQVDKVSDPNVVPPTVLLEQFLDGDEVDVDVVMSNGEWRYVAITDNGPTLEPYFNETWGVCPSLLSVEKQRELKEFALDCVKALGICTGVLHVECKYTTTGPQLIEVNARMGGGPMYDIHRTVWGVDLVEEAIFVSLGVPSRPPVPEKPLTSVAFYLVPAMVSGSVQHMPCLDELQRHQDIIKMKPLVKLGDHIVGYPDGMPTWMLDILAKKPTSREAVDFIMRLADENKVIVGSDESNSMILDQF
jgi:carnosine synthase